MDRFTRHSLTRSCAASAVLLSFLCSSAFAQDANDGWQDLEGLIPNSSSGSKRSSSDDGWIDLDNYPDNQSGAQVTASETQGASDGGWLDIDKEIEAASQGIVLPSSVIAAGDLLDISIANVDRFNGAYRVSELGTIVMPLIGSVNSAGRNVNEIKAELETRYGADYLVNPDITVTTREKIIGQVYLTGLLNRPRTISITSALSLAEVLDRAGGVNGARPDLDAIILRKIGNAIRARRVPLSEISANALPGPTILPDDRINILKRKKLADIKNENGQFPLLDKVLGGGTLVNY